VPMKGEGGDIAMRQFSRMLILILAAVVLLLTTAPAALAREPWPNEIALPNGWLPEGVVTGRGPVIYSGSRADGAIYAANLRTGEGDVLVQGQAGRVAVGLDFDRSTNYIYVAGGGTGDAYVYDAATGAEVGAYELTTATPTFVNDVIVTRKAAYFTDSQRAVLYRLPLGPGGTLPAPDAVETIPLSGDYQQVTGTNANGIEARANDKFLIVVNSALGTLYRVDPATGDASLIDLGGATVTMGDGILLRGHTLYVVRNRANEIVEIELAPDLNNGTVVNTITNAAFDVPTTIAWFRGSLYAVNARFGVPSPQTASYNIVRVPVKP
jgi:sugar lactone lactonase YvrE